LLSSAWRNIAYALLVDLAAPTANMRQTVAAAIHSLGQRLLADRAMRTRVNRTIEAVATEIIPRRAQLAQFIIEVVRQWDTRTFTERLELVVGRDLQYIRITGTLVGGLVGCFLYLLSAALG
jgi:uncharacterized membrane-anchored protein YjiN (DUF445 family)